MHPFFADWYRTVDLDPSNSPLDVHWAVAAEEVAENSSVRESIDLAALFLGADADDARERIVSAAKAADDAFPMRGNAALVNVLAGGALVHLMGLDMLIGDVAALALACGRAGGLGPTGPLPDVAEEAEETLDRRARSFRQFSAAGLYKRRKPMSFDDPMAGTEPLPASPNPNNWSGAWSATQGRANELREGISAVNENAKNAATALSRRLNAVEKALSGNAIPTLDEESTILWWLFGERSADLDVPLRDLGEGVRGLVVGKEIAERTRFPLAHPASRALLDRAVGDSDGLVSLLGAVRAATEGWVDKWVPSAPGLPFALVPVHAAAWFRRQFGPDEQDRQFEKHTGLAPDVAMSAVDIAYQTLLESLLLRAAS